MLCEQDTVMQTRLTSYAHKLDKIEIKKFMYPKYIASTSVILTISYNNHFQQEYIYQ